MTPTVVQKRTVNRSRESILGGKRTLTNDGVRALSDLVMHPVPKTASEALAIFRDPTSKDWERDYAAMMITSLDEALPDLLAMARDSTASQALQQRAAECLAVAWRSRGLLMSADISGFTPVARQEMLFHRREGPSRT
jgi:hypothetical protein